MNKELVYKRIKLVEQMIDREQRIIDTSTAKIESLKERLQNDVDLFCKEQAKEVQYTSEEDWQRLSQIKDVLFSMV